MTKKLTDEEKAAKKAAKQAGKAPAKKKAKVAKPKKAAKAKAPKKPKDAGAGKIGHNSGEINQALIADIVEIEELMANSKEIAKAIRDKVASVKDRHGISSSVLKHEIRMRKMETDVRADFEHGVKDLESMIGYQLALALETTDGEEGENGLTGETQLGDGEDDTRMVAGGIH